MHFVPQHFAPVHAVMAADVILDGPRVVLLPPEVQPGQVYEIVLDNNS